MNLKIGQKIHGFTIDAVDLKKISSLLRIIIYWLCGSKKSVRDFSKKKECPTSPILKSYLFRILYRRKFFRTT